MSMIVGGIDEVGRGALAGSLVSVVALFEIESQEDLRKTPIRGLADSKKFPTMRKREVVWTELIRSPLLIDFGLGEVGIEEINTRGIDWANAESFKRAVLRLRYIPDMIYVDGVNPIVGWPKERQHVEPQSDSKYWPTSAASILAKIARDRAMIEAHAYFPYYGWSDNMGYGAPAHKVGLRQHGPCPLHRTQFIKKILRAA